MKEIEILVSLRSSENDALAALARFGASKETRIVDEYFRHPTIPHFDPAPDGRLTACMRLRVTGGTAKLTHKIDHFNDDGSWLYSDETEVVVGDADNTRRILQTLGFVPLVTIDAHKRKFHHAPYEIVFERIEGLGLFLEVELCTDDDLPVREEKERIRAFIATLGLHIGEELDMGKPELMLRTRK